MDKCKNIQWSQIEFILKLASELNLVVRNHCKGDKVIIDKIY